MRPDSQQFNTPKTIDTGDNAPEIRLGSMTGEGKASLSTKPSGLIGGPSSIMQAISSFGRDDSDAVAKVGENKAVNVSTKGGRNKVASQLGLPNKKRFRAKKGK